MSHTHRLTPERLTLRLPVLRHRLPAVLPAAALALALALALVSLLAVPPAQAQPDLPDLTGRVVDRADILPAAAEAALAERLAAHERATSNQVVVATVPSLQGYDIERFANDLFRAWALGQADRDNGVLLLVALEERLVRIEVGYGLEGTLTDALSADIIRNRILPRFRAGDLADGVQAGTLAILAAIDGVYQAAPAERTATQRQPERQDVWPVVLFVGWFLFLMLRRRLGRRGRRRLGRGYRYGPYMGPMGGFGGRRSGGSRGGFGGGGGSSGGGGASGRW